jgi:hypothetical protein
VVEQFGSLVPQPQQPGEGDVGPGALIGEDVRLDQIEQRLGEPVARPLGLDPAGDLLCGSGTGGAEGPLPDGDQFAGDLGFGHQSVSSVVVGAAGLASEASRSTDSAELSAATSPERRPSPASITADR